MTSERWDRLTAIFHAAAELDPVERQAFLDEACGDDAVLRREVERLIAVEGRVGRFIEVPAILGGARLEPRREEAVAVGRRVGAFRVVRDIGEGGMGAVYLAERADGLFEQCVAIKLVRRGMYTALVLKQFGAERQILASLDHPNIARLLDGGTTDDGQPYFAMEYVDGQRIDAYADARHLSVPDRLRLFLKVCDAVAYAHRRLVIHRDIKPMNILVTGEGVPKLLDFGIAKVFQPGTDEPTSPVTGLRLLTPEYASPEQVQGGTVTAASDVYSLGVVLYELLTGRSPYRPRSRDPVDVVEAVRTGDPERPSTAVTRGAGEMPEELRRPGVERNRVIATGAPSADALGRQLRGDLDTIVLMALRKEPESRYRSVELLAEDVQRHLDGLPVRARPAGLGYRARKFARRNRTALLAAGFAGAAALALGVGIDRLGAGRHAVPRVARAGVLAPRDLVLVADFADRAGDPSLAAALTEAFRVDLTQSPYIRVVSPRQIRTTLAQMEQGAAVALDDSLAREVAVRQGVKAVVTGSVMRAGGRYTLSAEILSAEGGDLLAGVRETAADSTDVIRAVDRLTTALRRRMGESLGSIRATPPLEQVTTPSLGALRAYSAGVRTIVLGNRARGLELLQQAIALDTGFASAYRMMGITYGDMVERGRAQSALDHAIANGSRLPYYERYHTLASRAFSLDDYPTAAEAYRRLLERYPNDVRALNNLSMVYGERRQYAAQESLLTRALAIDSSIPVLGLGLALARTGSGDFAGARRAIDAVRERFPDNFNAYLADIYLAAARQDWDAAENAARLRLTLRPADSLDALDGLETLAGILMTRGRLREAEQSSRQVLAIAAKIGSPGRYLSSALRIAYLALRYRHDADGAVRSLDSALRRFPLDSMEEADRSYDELARFFAEAGRPARARDLLAAAERTAYGGRPGARPNRLWSRGVIALAEGQRLEAVTLLRGAADTLSCAICALPDLGRAYEAAGERDSAVAAYERYLQLPWKWRFEPDAIDGAAALSRLGLLYEKGGDRARARMTYTRLLGLWRRADPELEPVLADVRRRLARLGGTGRAGRITSRRSVSASRRVLGLERRVEPLRPL